VTVAGQMILNTITGYSQKMKPGRLIKQAEDMRQQVDLCNAIFASINTLDAAFKLVLNAILDTLHRELDAAFRETHLFRYWDNVALSKNQRRGFEKIISLLKTLADPKCK
jgi:predicted ATP-grasp superfamily ATP-dependent carboligase